MLAMQTAVMMEDARPARFKIKKRQSGLEIAEHEVTHLPFRSWCTVGAFQLKVSVDQDLSVIVAETINDDDVRQRLVVPIVFTRA